MATSHDLTPETWISVFHLVRASDPRGVHTCALISQAWNAAATLVLYADIEITWVSGRGKKLIRTLKRHPSVALLVLSLAVDFPNFDEWSKFRQLHHAEVASQEAAVRIAEFEQNEEAVAAARERALDLDEIEGVAVASAWEELEATGDHA